MKVMPLPGLSKVDELVIVKSPGLKSRAFEYIEGIVSDPLDLSLGVMLTVSMVSSVYAVFSDVFFHQEPVITRISQKKIAKNQRFFLKFFAIANFFKWIDWVGKSKVTGIREYSFPRLSAIADVFYIYTYGYGCMDNLKEGFEARKAVKHHLSNGKSKKHYQAIEMRELAGYISNYSYVCFSGMSAAVFFTNTTLLVSAMTGTIAIYFLFLAVAGVAGVAAEEVNIKNKHIHWIKAPCRKEAGL